jgi:hypothetical protein
MTQTKPTRAAYLRAYRARTAAPRLPHVCSQCQTAFAVERGDARYCSDACRAAAWRAITHRNLRHSPEGWVIPANEYGAGERRACAFMVNQDFCGRLATWLGLSCTNHTRLIMLTYRCDAHCSPAMKAPCDPDAACHRTGRCPARDVTLEK